LSALNWGRGGKGFGCRQRSNARRSLMVGGAHLPCKKILMEEMQKKKARCGKGVASQRYRSNREEAGEYPKVCSLPPMEKSVRYPARRKGDLCGQA